MANRNFASGGKTYSMRVMPVRLDLNFEVDNTQVNGISNLNGPAIAAVYMHSAHATPSTLNPAAGSIVIQLQDNFNAVLAVNSSIESALSGSGSTSTTIHVPCVITDLGTATTAEFQAKGLPLGVTPAVGASFVPTASGVIGGSAEVQIAAATGSGIASIEVLGDPDMSVAPNRLVQSTGALIILQARDYAGAIAAPAAGSVISVEILLSNSSVDIG